MFKLSIATAVAGVMLASSASAAVLAIGLYQNTGIVASNNGGANCSSAGLAVNSTVSGVVKYPGAGKLGFTTYTAPFGGAIQLCNGFPAIPAGGLNGFSASATCALTSINGSAPPETVNFSFTATVTDANSGVGTTTASIPAGEPVGGGCTAVIDTTLARTGK